MTTLLPLPLPDAAQACHIGVWRVEHGARSRREASAVLHGAARRLLRRHGTDAAWTTGPHGKPVLAGGGPPHFSLSHGRGVGCVALCETAEVGVDLEPWAGWPCVGGWPVAFEGVFTPAERAWLAGRGAAGLYRLWTRKEAALKALGCGFAGDPLRCCVAPQDDPCTVGDRSGAVRLWSLDAAVAGHALALACLCR